MPEDNRVARALTALQKIASVTGDIRALQIAQKELADKIVTIHLRQLEIQAELRALKAETILAAIDRTQALVNSVQGDFHARLATLSEKVANLERGLSEPSTDRAQPPRKRPRRLPP